MSDAFLAKDAVEHVTLKIGPQEFGIPVLNVHDVFEPQRITPVPAAPPEIAGVLNLRGHIVTAIDARTRLGLPRREADAKKMAVSVERDGEMFGILIDAVGDVLQLTSDTHEPNPLNLDPRWAQVANGVHRLENRLLVVLDIERMLDLGDSSHPTAATAA